jgi:NADPH:quinone reductase-like Zn-dependent oxidoreductase
VQIAKANGATVTGVCSTGNVDLVRSLGADHIVDYTAEDLTARTDRYDVVLELAGVVPARRLRTLLTPRGTLIQLSGDARNRWTGPLGRVVAGKLGAVGSDQTVTTFTVAPGRDDLDALAALLEAGALRPHLHVVEDLAGVAAALEQLEAGHTRGKVVVRVAPSSSGSLPAIVADAAPLPTQG